MPCMVSTVERGGVKAWGILLFTMDPVYRFDMANPIRYK